MRMIIALLFSTNICGIESKFGGKTHYQKNPWTMFSQKIYMITCILWFAIKYIWSNYSDLTRSHPKWQFSKGNPFISGKSRLVKYHNSARSIWKKIKWNVRACFKDLPLDLDELPWETQESCDVRGYRGRLLTLFCGAVGFAAVGFYMWNRVDQLPVFPYNRGINSSTQFRRGL